MPMGQATTKVKTVKYFYLQAFDDLGKCQDVCYDIGYQSSVACFNDGGQKSWKLMLDSDKQTGVVAKIGEVLIWDGIKLMVFDLATALDRYNIS